MRKAARRMSGTVVAACVASFAAGYLLARYRYLPRREHRLRRGSRSVRLIHRPRRRGYRIIVGWPRDLGGLGAGLSPLAHQSLAMGS